MALIFQNASTKKFLSTNLHSKDSRILTIMQSSKRKNFGRILISLQNSLLSWIKVWATNTIKNGTLTLGNGPQKCTERETSYWWILLALRTYFKVTAETVTFCLPSHLLPSFQTVSGRFSQSRLSTKLAVTLSNFTSMVSPSSLWLTTGSPTVNTKTNGHLVEFRVRTRSGCKSWRRPGQRYMARTSVSRQEPREKLSIHWLAVLLKWSAIVRSLPTCSGT